MKKALLFVMVLVLSFAMSTNAQLLYEENFSYTGGTGLIGQGGWTITGTSVINPINVGNSPLTYTNYVGSNIGNSVPLVSTGQDVYNTFTNQTSGTIYSSLLVNVSAASNTWPGDYFFHLTQPPITSNAFYSRLFARVANNSNLTFGVSKTSTTTTITPIYSDSIYSLNTTYLIVLKYTFNTGGTTDDEVSLFVFSSPTVPSTEPVSANVGPITTSQTDATGLGIVNLRQGSSTTGPTVVVDGIRVSTAWSQAPLPVELTSFTGIVKGTGVELAWKTATEINNHGFEIERRASGGLHLEGGAHLAWTKIGFVEGHGTTNAPQSYTFVDGNASGTVAYRLKQIDRDGSFEYSNQVEVTVAAPVEFALMQNHPNPFNPATSINYTLPVAGHVSLKIYDMLGKEVATLVNGVQDAGAKIAQFNASQLPSGIYFYTLRTNTFNATKKMLLVK